MKKTKQLSCRCATYFVTNCKKTSLTCLQQCTILISSMCVAELVVLHFEGAQNYGISGITLCGSEESGKQIRLQKNFTNGRGALA